jgi:hypothetical protein
VPDTPPVAASHDVQCQGTDQGVHGRDETLPRATLILTSTRGTSDKVGDMEWLWVVLGLLYFACLVTLGIVTLRKGHWVMFIIGIFFPLLWIIGALVPPTDAAIRRSVGP